MDGEITDKPGLFGIVNSNRNFSLPSSWGKNLFNNAFPVALLNYMHSRAIEPVYIRLAGDLSIIHEKLSVERLYGINPGSGDIYFSFEDSFEPYRELVVDVLPRVDLVIKQKEGDTLKHITPIEIKLTALPDDQTSLLSEENYGSEIVVRPDTIVYLALSFAIKAKKNPLLFSKYLKKIFDKKIDWEKSYVAAAYVPELIRALELMIKENPELETPLMVQPVWKTKGKSAALAENCLDAFIWSNFALTRLFFREADKILKINRPERAVVWLAMMLNEFSLRGKINHQKIIDTYTFDTKNDKAFAIGGLKTWSSMKSPELTKPRIKREEIQWIILKGGEKLLSPERRFDGIIQGTIDLFKS